MKTKTPIIIILILLFLMSMNTVIAEDSGAGGWISNPSIVNGLPSVNSPTLTVFYYEGVHKLISGNSAGTFTGYYWSGSTWVSDPSIVAGLVDVGTFSAPTVYNDSGTLKLITGERYGEFIGYYWSGSAWVPDSSIVDGLVDVGDRSTLTVFNDLGTWKLIAGEYDGFFNGYYWSGSAWVPDSSVVSGLGDVGYNSAPTVFNDSGTLKLISGEQHFIFNGFYWSGSTWVSDSSIVAGLPTSGYDTLTPVVYNDSGTWKLISGEDSYETFIGFYWELTPAIPISLNNIYSDIWVNWSWSQGSGGSFDTDSYNVSINRVWNNGSSNTYYNHYLSSGGTSTIIVFAYNLSDDVLSYKSVTSSESTTYIPPTEKWVPNSSVITGLGSPGGDYLAPTVFNDSGTLKLISGEEMGIFHGFYWSGSTWVSSSSVVSGLSFHANGYYSHPTVFNDGGTWKLIYGAYNDNFYGYYWTGSTWTEDSSIVSGLSVTGYAKPTVYNDSGTLKLISGSWYGTFTGFYWSGSTWVSDPSIVAGLVDVGLDSAADVYYDSGTLKLIAGEGDGNFNGYYWSGSTWVSDSSVVDDLGDVGYDSTPAVYNDAGTWKLISGNDDDYFYGCQMTPTTPTPTTPGSLIGVVSITWVNWTWVEGTLAPLDTDSFNVSISGIWNNGSLNTYYNHHLPSGGTSTIIVWAYNSTNDVLSYESITNTESTPITPPDPINLGNSTYNFGVNFTFEPGTGFVTDSFNIGTNNGGGIVWNNGSSNPFSNTSTSAHGYVNIIVYAYNDSGIGALSVGYLSDNVTIPNNAISIINVTDYYSINEFELLFIDANITDPDGDTPTFSCNRTDLFTDFNTATGTGSWTPSDIHSGNYSVKFGVSDGYGSTDIQTTLIMVADTVDPNPSEGEGGIVTWKRISDYPGDSTITQGTSPSFGIGRKGYAIASNQETWEFDADSGSWTRKTDISSSSENPTYLAINNKAYVIGGVESGVITGKVREYIPNTNLWNEERNEYIISGGATGVVLPVIEDGYVFKYAPDTNYSTPGPLYIGDNRNAYLKYDISGIPSNARITDITQYIYWNGHCSLCGIEGSPTYTRKTTSNWNSNTLTWNNQPTVQVSSITVYFHMWFNQPSIGSPASSHIQDSIDDGDSWYGTQITTFSEPGPNNNVYGSFNSIEDCAGCPELWKTLLPGSKIVVDWVPKIPLMVASFDIGDRGYTLTADGNLQSYDQFSNSWQDHSSIPSSDDVTWAISYNGKGYALVGNTMWEYTPSGDDWAELSSTSHFNSLQYPAGFILEDIIYVGTGLLDGTKTASMFSFNPATDTWALESTSFPSARSRAIAFSIDNGDGSKTAYMGGGIGSVLHDFYEMGITPAVRPTSTPIFIVPDITLPIEEFEFPELEIPEVLKDTIFEEILVFIGKIFSWLFILAAYFGAFVASVILMRENEDLNDTKYSIFLFGTIGWIVPLIINFIGLMALVTQSFTLNVIIFAAFGFVSYAILNIFNKED